MCMQMRSFREIIESHPLPWFLGSVIVAFVSGIGAYQSVLSWSGMKIVHDESEAKLSLHIAPTPTDSIVSLSDDPVKFFQGMPIPDGQTTLAITRDGYRTQNIHLAKSGSKIVLSVPLQRIPSIVQTGKTIYTGDRLSLVFDEIELQSIFQIIKEFVSEKDKPINFVLGPQVVGSISLKLDDVPWDQALDVITAQAGLKIKKDGNVIFIDYAL